MANEVLNGVIVINGIKTDNIDYTGGPFSHVDCPVPGKQPPLNGLTN